MIKIHDKLWYVVKPGEEDNLAYMTYLGNDSAFEKRKDTGTSWAEGRWWGYVNKCYISQPTPEPVVVDNSSTTGFYIGSSVSRWSTDNKLFRVTDPRGFTVEVPTGNISTLLHLTTVVNGVIQQPCVWGREGNSHILLPVNSEPYLKSLEQMDTLANKLIPIKDLKPGAVVKFFGESQEYHFLGRGKPTWKIKPYHYTGWGGSRWGTSSTKVDGKEYEATCSRYLNIFKVVDERYPYYRDYTTAKIVEVLRNEPRPADNTIKLNVTGVKVDSHYESEVVSITWKQ